MKEATFVVGKRSFTNKRSALKALKQFERRVSKRITKAKSHPRYLYDEE